jgi:stage III sporulation protein AE
MTAALAAQGGITESSALYIGSTVFITVLNALTTRIMIPMIFFYIAFAVSFGAIGDEFLKKSADLIKNAMTWTLKTMLMIFTTYMSISGVISGTTDMAVLKAAKVTISSFVPVVGSILSDASETVLVSAQIAKNAAGVYGIFALLAVFLVPFFRIGIHYLMLKGTFVVSSILCSGRVVDLIGDFSAAMGLLLAMTGAVCVIQLISTICFLKGVV